MNTLVLSVAVLYCTVHGVYSHQKETQHLVGVLSERYVLGLSRHRSSVLQGRVCASVSRTGSTVPHSAVHLCNLAGLAWNSGQFRDGPSWMGNVAPLVTVILSAPLPRFGSFLDAPQWTRHNMEGQRNTTKHVLYADSIQMITFSKSLLEAMSWTPRENRSLPKRQAQSPSRTQVYAEARSAAG